MVRLWLGLGLGSRKRRRASCEVRVGGSPVRQKAARGLGCLPSERRGPGAPAASAAQARGLPRIEGAVIAGSASRTAPTSVVASRVSAPDWPLCLLSWLTACRTPVTRSERRAAAAQPGRAPGDPSDLVPPCADLDGECVTSVLIELPFAAWSLTTTSMGRLPCMWLLPLPVRPLGAPPVAPRSTPGPKSKTIRRGCTSCVRTPPHPELLHPEVGVFVGRFGFESLHHTLTSRFRRRRPARRCPDALVFQSVSSYACIPLSKKVRRSQFVLCVRVCCILCIHTLLVQGRI